MTAIGSGSSAYTASYDADGNMTCRAPTGSVTCTGTSPTGQVLTYDAERRLVQWASGPGLDPAHETAALYDGEGHRVEQWVGAWTCTNACWEQTQSDTLYLAGGVEEITTAGSSTTTTKYYRAGGLLIGVSVNGTISYLASDGLGSVSVALSSSGSETAAQLFTPYGTVRYSSGTMPTARGFTGQYGDAITGLSYYGARYYDPVAGQFTTADSIQGPNRYGYVAGNPTTATDPSGHLYEDADRGLIGGGGRAPGEVSGGAGEGGEGGDGGITYTANWSADGTQEIIYGSDDSSVKYTFDSKGDVTSETNTDANGNSTKEDLAQIEQEAEASQEVNAVHADEGHYAEEEAQAQAHGNENEGNPGSHGNGNGNGNGTGNGNGNGATGNPGEPGQPPTTSGENGGGNNGAGNGSGGNGDPNQWAQPNANQTRVGHYDWPQYVGDYRSGSLPRVPQLNYRIFVGEPGFARPGGSGPIYMEFNVPTTALNQGGTPGWFWISTEGIDVPIDGLIVFP